MINGESEQSTNMNSYELINMFSMFFLEYHIMANRYIYGFNREFYLEYHGHIDGRDFIGNIMGI